MPRPFQPGAGFRGPGQEVFPEAPKEHARILSLTDQGQIYRNDGGLDDGGAPDPDWKTFGGTFRARIDVLGSMSGIEELVGEQLSDQASHIISTDDVVPIKSDDRIGIGGQVWEVLSIYHVTGQNIQRIAVKGTVDS